MARATVPPLDRQVSRVRRRLFLQTLLNALVGCWLGALVLAAGWFLAQPFFFAEPWPLLRWVVLGGLVGTGTVLGVVLAWLRTPSSLAAALTLDERFGLKERVTTGLTLRPEEAASPVGQALLQDANQRVEPLRVGERFPVRLPWAAVLVPALALLLGLLVLFYKPQPGQAKDAGKEAVALNPDLAKEIQQQMKQLQKKPQPRPLDRRKSEDLERLEEERDRLARAPTDTREQAKEVVKEMGALEEQMQKRDKELAQRVDAFKEQMKQAERLSKQEKKDGPAKGIDRALKQGDFKKAQDEAERLRKQLNAEEEKERLRKKLQDPNLDEKERDKLKKQLDDLEKNRLNPEERERLRQQLKDLQNQIERLSRDLKEQEKELRDKAERGEIDPEQLERELDQLRQNLAKLDDKTLKALKELADKLGQCEACLKEGKDGEAAQKLEELAELLAQLDPDGERQDLADQIKKLRQCRGGLCRALEGNNPAMGRRPESKEGPTQHQEKHARSELDKGGLQIVDHVPGQGFKGPRKPAELTEEIRQAAQAAPEAIDRQRLPRSASDMARGYFEKLRPPEKNNKKEKE
jgi:hypothetical protein